MRQREGRQARQEELKRAQRQKQMRNRGIIIGVIVLALVNLRGIKEAGSVFAVPTYIFMASILGMTAVGAFQAATGQLGEAPSAAFTIARP